MPSRRRQALEKVLGPLETEVMRIIWSRGRVTVRDVYEELLSRREIAYTTVMTTMGRLSDKGLLKREESYPAYVYEALLSQEQYERSTVKSVVDWLVNQFRDPAVAYFVDRVEEEEPALIESLRRAIEQRRREH